MFNLQLIKNMYLTESGALYIWGKGSHVINTTQGMSSNCHCPQLLSSDSSPVLDVFCGAWHAAAITGKPGVYICVYICIEIVFFFK